MFKSSAGIKWYQIPEYNWQIGTIQSYSFKFFSCPTIYLAKKDVLYECFFTHKRANLAIWSRLRATGFIPTSAETFPVSLHVPVGPCSCWRQCPTIVPCCTLARLCLVKKQWGWLCHMGAGEIVPVPCGPVSSFSVLQTQHRSEGCSSQQGTATQESKLVASLSTVLCLTSKKEIHLYFCVPRWLWDFSWGACWIWMNCFWMVH